MIEKLPNFDSTEASIYHVEKLYAKVNQLVDAVNELQNRIDPPSVYQVMKDKDAIIGKHIVKKQRLQDELDRTKKQLETAVSALKYIQDGNLGFSPAIDFAEKALEQITALEQKDVK